MGPPLRSTVTRNASFFIHYSCHCRPLSWSDQSWLHETPDANDKSWYQILWCQALNPIMTLCVFVISPFTSIIFLPIINRRQNCVSQGTVNVHLLVTNNYSYELSIKWKKFHFWNGRNWNSLENIGLFSADFSS